MRFSLCSSLKVSRLAALFCCWMRPASSRSGRRGREGEGREGEGREGEGGGRGRVRIELLHMHFLHTKLSLFLSITL